MFKCILNRKILNRKPKRILCPRSVVNINIYISSVVRMRWTDLVFHYGEVGMIFVEHVQNLHVAELGRVVQHRVAILRRKDAIKGGLQVSDNAPGFFLRALLSRFQKKRADQMPMMRN